MDPVTAVGLAASILQIINTTAHTIQYLKDVEGAPHERNMIVQEAATLLELLTSLKRRVDDADPEEAWYNHVRAMVTLADKFKPRSSIKEVGKRLVWTLDKKQINATLDLIERLKSSISIALQGDSFALSLALKNDIHGTKNQLTILNESLDDISGDLQELKLVQQSAAGLLSEQEKQNIIDWLSPLNFASKQVDLFSRHQECSGKWLFEESLFKDWLASRKRTLLCPGIPGAGKTILMSIVIDYLRQNRPIMDTTIAYLYISYGDQKEQSAQNLLGALLQQVVRGKSFLSPDIKRLYDNHKSLSTRPTAKVFVLVDALDECSEDNGTRGSILSELRGLLEASNIRLMITSRHVSSIKEFFEDTACLEIRAADDDIRKYLETRIPKEPRLVRAISGDASFQSSIVDTMIAKAKGMFLMAELHLASLAKKNNKRDVRSALQTLPKDLDHTYDDAMQRISRQNEEDVRLAKRVLMWISCALRPLSVEELQHALAAEPDTKDLDPESLPYEDIVVSVCSGLVTIDRPSNNIRLVHYTTKEYLMRVRSELFPTAQIDITLSCMTYLLYNTFARISPPDAEDNPQSRTDWGQKIQVSYPFLSYAVRFWGTHALGAPENNVMIQHLAQMYLENNSLALDELRNIPFKKERFVPVAIYLPGMQIAACFDLTSIVDMLITRGVPIDGTGVRSEMEAPTALYCAAAMGNVATVRLLLDRGAWIDRPNRHRETALMITVICTQEAMVRLLLEEGASVSTQDENQKTALHKAARAGSTVLLELLLENNADIDARDKDGQTALFEALRAGYQGVKLLLEKGADTNIRDKYHNTALHQAVRYENHAAIELLIKEGADINARDMDDKTENGDVSTVESLLKNRADINAQHKDGATALHQAVARESGVTVVKLLLGKGGDINARTKEGKTVLHQATEDRYCTYKEGSLLKLLLENGADVNACDDDGRTALHRAVRSRNDTVVRALLERSADVNARDKDEKTALHQAVGFGNATVIELLLEKGSDVNVSDIYGKTALYRAAAYENDTGIRLLLEKGADVNARSKNGRTALHQAARYGNKAVVKLLLKNGADVNTQDRNHRTALDQAKRYRKATIMKLLLDKGDRKALHEEAALKSNTITVLNILIGKGAGVDARDQDGRTALHRAVEYQPKFLGRKIVIKLLLEKGADVNAREQYEETVLHKAVSCGDIAVVELLLEEGADIDARDQDGRTALHGVAWYQYDHDGREKMMELLLEKGADVNAKDRDGATTLHQAAVGGHSRCVELLLAKGADVHVRNKNGRTALLRLAGRYKFDGLDTIMKLLLEKGAEVNTRGKEAETALHRAAYFGNDSVVELLLEKGAVVDLWDQEGWTPLHSAAFGNYEKIVRLLVNGGANREAKISGLGPRAGRTALEIAEDEGHSNLVRFLQEAEAEAKRSVVGN